MTAVVNFPVGTKIYGLNSVIPYGSYGAYSAGVTWTWGTLWQGFSTDYWLLHQRKQIDLAYAAGCNVVRVVGDLQWVNAGNITQTAYNAAWVTAVQYAHSLGLSVYAVMSGNATNANPDLASFDGTMTTAQIITAVNSLLAALNTAGCTSYIIGVDVINEMNAWAGCAGGGGKIVSATTIYAGIKAGGTTLPITFSSYEDMTTASVYATAGFYDYSDFHLYHTIAALYPLTFSYGTYVKNGTTGPLDRRPTIEVIFGEFGQPMSESAADRATFWTACLTTGNNADPLVRGGLGWAVADQNAPTIPTDQWGLTDSSYVPKALPAQTWINSTGSAVLPTAPATPINPRTGIILCNPFGTTNAFKYINMYRNGVLLQRDFVGYLDDTAYLATATRAKYEFTVVNTNDVESAKSAALQIGTPATKMFNKPMFNSPMFNPAAGAGTGGKKGMLLGVG